MTGLEVAYEDLPRSMRPGGSVQIIFMSPVAVIRNEGPCADERGGMGVIAAWPENFRPAEKFVGILEFLITGTIVSLKVR